MQDLIVLDTIISTKNHIAQINENFSRVDEGINERAMEDHTHAEYALSSALVQKVDVVAGKALSTNDYSDTEKTKVTTALADSATAKAHALSAHAPVDALTPTTGVQKTSDSELVASAANEGVLRYVKDASGVSVSMCVDTTGDGTGYQWVAITELSFTYGG